MSGESTRLLGRWGEALVAEYLRRRGFRLLAAGWQCRYGEIDLIAEDEQYILFTEVKLRKSAAFAPARASVDRRKQARLRTTAELYLAQFPTGRQPRFDVAEVYAPEGTATRDPEIHYIVEVFDGHCDTILRCYLEGGGFRERPGHLDLTRTRKFSRYAQFFACFGEPEDMPGRPLWEVFQEEVALFRREMEQNADRVVFCRSGREAEAAFAGGRAAAFLSAEGAELLDCDLDKLRQAHAWGVRAVNLTWNHPNALSGTNAEERERGLSSKGRAFVREMQRLGMLVDVSHLSDPGFWDVMEIAEKPIFASHSNARDVFFDTRNLTDAQFTAIIKNNGVAGLNLYAGFLGKTADLDTVTRHLEHFLALGGERNLSLGGDWDGCAVLPRGMEGIQDLDRLYEHLLRRNYHEELVRGIFYSNLMRVVSEVCNT